MRVVGAKARRLQVLSVVAFLALQPSSARADDWTTTDTIVEFGCVTLLLIDWGQSLDRRYQESNPILGSHPSGVAVDGYFAAVIGVQVLVARLVPSPWRGVFQGVVLGVEGRSVVNNWRMGARLAW